MLTIDAQVHAYERNHPGRPWHAVLTGPPEVTGDQMVAAMDAVGVDVAAQQRLWRVREAITDILGVYGPPLKFDVSLPLPAIPSFAAQSGQIIADHTSDAIPLLFGHIGEGNLHLNVLRHNVSAEAEHELYTAMMQLIAACGGNVSSEHGVGTRKREFVGMSRTPTDIAAMRAVKAAFDPTGYLNSAVLFG